MSNSIEFKGAKDGIYLKVQNKSIEEVTKELEKKIEKFSNFFKGAKIIGIDSQNLNIEDKIDILNLLKYKYNFELADDAFERFQEPKEEIFSGIKEGMTKFIRNTVRSGQVVHFEGNIVVIGDVNPGGLIEAYGNIIILGCLKGTAHAGINGNRESIVAAYDLEQAMQIRIADKITRRPDMEHDGNTIACPEVAKIEGDRIYIEPYLYKNRLGGE